MIIYSQDKKGIVDAKLLQVNRMGVKDKFCVMASGGFSGAIVTATFDDEKSALDALKKAYDAFANGAVSYSFD